MEPEPDSAPRAACRAPVTYFRVICRRGVLPLAVGAAIGAEPSGCVGNAAVRVEGRGFPLPRPSSALHSLPGTAARSGGEGAGGGCTFQAEAGAGLWRCLSNPRDRLTEEKREGIPRCRAAPPGKSFDSLRAKPSPGRVGRGSPETASGPSALKGPRGARPPKAAPGPVAPTWPCAAGVGQLRGRKQERGRPPLGVRSAFPGPECPRRSRRPSS